MRNRADNPYRLQNPAHQTQADWGLDRHPAIRLSVLFAAFFLAILTIGSRLAYVQGRLSDRYIAEFDRTVERLEPIPSHDGRILAANGEVLAEDREIFGLKVHYRWLEDPPDPVWLKSQALARLDRPSRRDPKRVAQERDRVLTRRAELWNHLGRATGLDSKTLTARRREVQKRIEHIYELVEQRRAARSSAPSAGGEAQRPPTSSWEKAWQTLVAALTTPPVREADELLVLREQLDYHMLVPEVSLETAVEIESHPELYPATRVAVTTRRVYPQGDLAPHLVGYRTPLDDSAVQERATRLAHGDPLDYQAGDRVGRTGLERYYERHLRGLRGRRKLVLDRRGEVLRTETVREPRYGHDLVLSLNVPLQRSAEQLLDDALHHAHVDETNGKLLPIPRGGAIVALDVRTGAVLAAASAPRFDLGLLVDPEPAAWQQILADPRKPLFHRAAEMALPPGSVFKVLSAIAFLESGRIDPARKFHCQGFLDDPDHNRCLIYRNFGASHGDLDLVDALARSCNVYFFSAARRVGREPITDWAARFGFGQPTGIDLPGERGGKLPGYRAGEKTAPRAVSARSHPTEIQNGMQLAIGQAALTTTPLQIARLMAAVANGGKLVTPKLVDSTGPMLLGTTGPGDGAFETSDARPVSELSKRTLEWVRLGLAHVVSDRQGTGYKTVRLDEIAIAGKTGTAEPGGDNPDHAWFAGYVPAHKPKIAFVVVLENAGSGGHAAGPVARKLVQAMIAEGLLEGRMVSAPSAN